MFKIFMMSLGVTFLAGSLNGIYENRSGSNGNATYWGFFASDLVDEVITAPTKSVIGGLGLSSETADSLVRVILDLATPYRMSAYAGAYS